MIIRLDIRAFHVSIFLMLPILSLITLSFAAHAVFKAWNAQMSSLTPFCSWSTGFFVDRVSGYPLLVQ
jgi:hypothetical protein